MNRSSTLTMGGHLLNVLANHAILAECAPPGQSGEFYFAIFGEFIFAIDSDSNLGSKNRFGHTKGYMKTP